MSPAGVKNIPVPHESHAKLICPISQTLYHLCFHCIEPRSFPTKLASCQVTISCWKGENFSEHFPLLFCVCFCTCVCFVCFPMRDPTGILLLLGFLEHTSHAYTTLRICRREYRLGRKPK